MKNKRMTTCASSLRKAYRAMNAGKDLSGSSWPRDDLQVDTPKPQVSISISFLMIYVFNFLAAKPVYQE
jgi:hypothetical protein